MRRILVDHARRRRADRRGGDRRRVPVEVDGLPAPNCDPDEWLALDECLTRFEAVDPAAAGLVKLRLFAGLSVEEAGDALGLPRATAYRNWTFARAWLSAALADHSSGPPDFS